MHPRHSLSHPRNRDSHLACAVLAQGPHRAKGELEITFWSQTVPQLIDTIPPVAAAATAFGASFEEHALNRTSSLPAVGAVQKYCHALRIVQQEVAGLQYGTLPCMVACLLMAFTEVLQQRINQAFLHVQGSFALMMNQGCRESTTQVDQEGISTLFEKLDLHAATYVQSRSPSVPSLYAATPQPIPLPPDRALCRVLRASYHFTSTARRWKYTHPREIPSALFIEQGRHLGSLRHWLSSHRREPSLAAGASQNQQLIVLRAQSLAGFIHCANFLEPTEVSYDAYSVEFQEIIALAESLFEMQLEEQQRSPTLSTNKNMPTFTPEMGIAQPLFLTVLKYRHPFWRRKALHLLLKSGKEGPWCGIIEGTLLKVVIEAEEDMLHHHVQTADIDEAENIELAQHDPSSIIERQRVHLFWVVGYLDQHQDSIGLNEGQGARAKFAQVQLCKCRDIDSLLNVERSEPDTNFWHDQAHWDTWIKTVQLPGYL